ncbi:BTAD domain-containing putative transcriptional regulator [Streptomyces sp. MH60]|uniref:BTAD domain-containing putative transcriptional regulator n=1 Tax=Streptomyces sp. MH60 TaxID=1940758 RepID=UPI000CEE81E9|nr:BTAD domain-containing putative transcriptional regulator [Streptomyces sp. MH60]PPS90819.1 Serine/threonine-protein kinase PknK [Streptomyces sp. MH60]
MVIRRKLTAPEPGDDIVRRDRLTERIRSLVDRHPVVTVCATAGGGKTTAVAVALRDLGRPIAWLSLDGTEQAPGRLLVYLEAAVEGHVPAAGHVATDALHDGIRTGEAAGLLAESLQGSGLVLVCDNVERIASDEGCVAILSALARYLPAGVSLVLLSRTRVRLDFGSIGDVFRVGELGEEDLAFDADEAAKALRLVGESDADVESVVDMTGGWVAGVLFEGWRSAEAADDRSDALRDYLSANILRTLPADERTFLLHTSPLAEISVADAVALGQSDAARLMTRLRSQRLPVLWSRDGTRLTPHHQFREFLAGELERTEHPEKVRRLHRLHADLLVQQGALEEAVDIFLRLGDTEDAWRQAAVALPDLVARMDFASAARWLDAMDASRRTPTPEVGTVVLRVSFALEQWGRGNELLDRHGYDWLPGPDSPHFEEALLLTTWCLWHSGRLAEARTVADRLPAGRAREGADNLLALSGGDAPPFPEPVSGSSGTVDGLLMRIAYFRGRLGGLERPGAFDPWRSVLGAPWIIAGLRATGRLDEAMEMYEVRRDSWQPPWLHAFDAVDLMVDLGRPDEAWAALKRGRRLIAETGSRLYHVFGLLNEAKLCLRLHRDTDAADRALAEAEASGASEHAFSRELGQLWRGLSLLIRNRDTEARTELETCVDGMRRGDRRLELATAAAYLAEAYWRLGEEEASDAAAELALTESAAQGSQHLLLAALTDVPAVAVREADASPTRMSRWHELIATLSSQDPLRVSARAPRLSLEEFGEPVLTVDGQETAPRLSKSMELLSYLLGARREVPRQELLDALFDGRDNAAGRSYLRQTLYRLREVLPEELVPHQDGDRFSLACPDLVSGTAQVVLDSLVQADHQDGEIRLRTMTEALAHADRGPYLEPVSSLWVEQRRSEIDERVTGGRIEAARLAFRLSRYREARRLVNEVLRTSPHREQAWQLAISLAHASGSDDSVLGLYRRYTTVMREFGVAPSAEVRRLVSRLRR